MPTSSTLVSSSMHAMVTQWHIVVYLLVRSWYDVAMAASAFFIEVNGTSGSKLSEQEAWEEFLKACSHDAVNDVKMLGREKQVLATRPSLRVYKQ